MRMVVWAVLGAVFGTALDALHVVTGTLSYAHPVMGLQDWWVVPQFAIAGILLGETHRRVAVPLSGQKVPVASTGEMARGVVVFVVVYAASGFLKMMPAIALVLFTAAFIGGVLTTPKSAQRALLLHGLGAGLMGPAAEALISSTGTFHYTFPDVMGVPVWLPALYLNAARASHVVDRWLMARERGQR